MLATIASKGQVTLPKRVRDKLRLKPGDEVDFALESDGTLRVTPVTTSVTQLKGMLPEPDLPISAEEMNEAVARMVAR